MSSIITVEILDFFNAGCALQREVSAVFRYDEDTGEEVHVGNLISCVVTFPAGERISFRLRDGRASCDAGCYPHLADKLGDLGIPFEAI